MLDGLNGLGAGGSEAVQADEETGAEAVVVTIRILGITPQDATDLVRSIPGGYS